MNTFFQNVLNASFHGSIVILAVLILRLVLRKAPKKFICWLWTLAGLRLLMPIPLQSPFSLQPKAIPISVDLSAWLPVVWVAVAVIIGSYSFLSYIHLRRRVLDAVKVPGGWESDRIDTAFVLGFLKPKIYIPTGMPKEAKKQILAHERTHLDKGDHWIKVIGFLALALHWFNPLVWLSYILLCKDIEMACDERVVQFMELEERKAYSAALLRCSTNHPHYAACPVAFGEVSVKYRIKSVLNYRKPSFWLSLLCIIAIAFVAVCLMTSPETVVEVDPDASLGEISRQDPADFTPAVMPQLEDNPDWGVEVIVDATSPTGGKVVYEVHERFAAASESITMKDGSIDRWNGTEWEPVPSLSTQTKLFEEHWIGFAQSRDRDVNYHEEELDWTLYYGPLPAGDYRLSQTIESDTDSAVFRTAFHIYREDLPKDQEAALKRCTTALDTLVSGKVYNLVFSEPDRDGNVTPVKRIIRGNGGTIRIDHFLGQFVTSSGVTEEEYYVNDWDRPFRLNQNRQFLFPEGQSVISQEEITFRSVWADFDGTVCHGKDTFRFYENGRLRSVERSTQTLDEQGSVAEEYTIRVENKIGDPDVSGWDEVESYDYEDSFDSLDKSPWDIFFRVDDDLLAPGGGEVWIGTDAVGVAGYTTDGKYWLEKKNGRDWLRLGGSDKEADWGGGTISISSRTATFDVDWSADYGQLDAGVYRMGKHFYSGDESIIQYSEFAIYQTGGVFGEGAEEALARVDAAMAKLQSGNYRVEKYESGYSSYDPYSVLTEVIWRYEDTVVYDFYNKASLYSHSVPDYPEDPADEFHLNWWERTPYPSEYDSVYFPQGYSTISDREISFVFAYSMNSVDDFSTLFTYRFDENGNLTEFIRESRDSMWKGHTTRYVVTEASDAQIQEWVETHQSF